LTVHVVEQRLQLQERSPSDEITTRDEERRDDTGRGVRDHDGGRRHLRPLEQRNDEVRERPEHGLEKQLASGSPSEGPTGSSLGRGDQPMVDTGAMTPEGWTEVDKALERTFQFESFVAGLAFVNRVGELAELENHHPDIAIHYNRVTLRWWTHTAGGITDRDRALAEKSSEIAP
jgi:4a-hydroxytetrahydrobiopterin dehydratase